MLLGKQSLDFNLLMQIMTKPYLLFKGVLEALSRLSVSIMEALLQIEAVSNAQNVKGLRRLYDNISSHMRSLESLEVNEETYGNLLCPI